jgi:choloylglycine hydrolase
VTRSPICLTFALAFIAYAPTSSACTTACLSGEAGPLITKSYDWHSAEGLVLINKAGSRKKAFLLDSGTPARWTSKYASVTFNQYGREMPNGGMNSEGLVVEIMWLPETITPPVDERPGITELQWIQYQLDNYSTLAQVIAHARTMRVSAVYGTVHYMVCDRSGQCAAFEYLNGRLVTTEGKQLSAPVLTNHSYQRSIQYLGRHKRFGGHSELKSSQSSLDRFTRAAAYVVDHLQVATISDGFDLLEQVSQGQFSVWNIVYDPKNLRVHFRTRDAPAIKTIRLQKFDASCRTPVLALDINTPKSGDVSKHMVDYTLEMNRDLLQQTLGQLKAIPSFVTLALAIYPASQTCSH